MLAINALTKGTGLTKSEPIEASGRGGWTLNLSVVDRVAAEHAHPRPKLATAKRDHMLANMRGNLLSVLNRGMLENPLN